MKALIKVSQIFKLPFTSSSSGDNKNLNLNENSKLRFILSPDKEQVDGSLKIWETFINAFKVLKFLSNQIYFFNCIHYEH